jgi:hypothetical protein
MRSAQDGAGQRTAKIAFPVGKADWHPSVLPGPIVLVSDRTFCDRTVRI